MHKSSDSDLRPLRRRADSICLFCGHRKKHHLAPGPCGTGTPYARLARMGGKVLFVGIDLTCITMFHGVEEEAGLAYVLQDEPVEARIVLPGGELRVRTRLHYYGPERRGGGDRERVDPRGAGTGAPALPRGGRPARRRPRARRTKP